jgi:hypothetical protein
VVIGQGEATTEAAGAMANLSAHGEKFCAVKCSVNR